MAQGVQPVLIVSTPLEGERACDTLREHKIKCACVEMPSPDALTNPLGYMSAGSYRTVFTVIVAPEDLDQAHQILEDWTDSQMESTK
jgi:hypothetical protein